MYRCENRRSLFRVNFPMQMCGSISICKIGQKNVKSGKSNICILDISAGGIQFKSKLSFPESDVLYKVSFDLYDNFYEIEGLLKWKKQNRNNTFNYGMMFLQSEKEKEDLVQVIAKLMVHVKKDVCDIYSICNSKCPNLEELKLK